MPIKSDPVSVAHAVGWRRAMDALAILVCSALLVFAAARTADAATAAPSRAASSTTSITDPIAVVTALNVAAASAACGEHVATSVPLRHHSMHGVDNPCPFEPDLWLDDSDDDDDDEVGRHGSTCRRSASRVEDALDLRRPSRTLGGSTVPYGSLPVNLFLSESARRM